MIRYKNVFIVSILCFIISGCSNQKPASMNKNTLNNDVQTNAHQIRSKGTTTELDPVTYTINQSTQPTHDTSEVKPPVNHLTKEFKSRAIQETNDKFVVKKYKTKQDLITYLSEIAAKPLATKFVNHYYIEEKGQLTIIPTEFIPWFQPSKPYQLKATSTNVYQLTQHNYSDLHGKYTIGITFTKVNNQWKITGVKINDYTI